MIRDTGYKTGFDDHGVDKSMGDASNNDIRNGFTAIGDITSHSQFVIRDPDYNSIPMTVLDEDN